ncbi:MAG: MlaD family protein [Myxococcota bacterium]
MLQVVRISKENMVNPTTQREIQVGAFVLVGAVILAVFVILLADVSLEPRVQLFADFGYSGALKVGAPVILSGVRIGRVADLSLLGPTASPPAAKPVGDLGRKAKPVVRAELEVEEQVVEQLSQDSRFYVGMQGVIGESYVELAPGTRGPSLKGGEAVRGVDAPELHLMVLRFADTLGTVRELFRDAAGEDLDKLAESVASIAATIDGVLADRQVQITQAIDDLTEGAASLKRVAAALDRGLGDGAPLAGLLKNGEVAAVEIRQRLPGLLERADRALAEIEGLSRDLRGTMDPKSVAVTLTKVQDAAHGLAEVTEDARFLTRSLRRGEGSLGALLRDPTVYEDVKELMRELKRNPWKLLWRE